VLLVPVFAMQLSAEETARQQRLHVPPAVGDQVEPLRGSIVTESLAISCVPKRNPIVLASARIEPHYTYAINNEKRYKP